VLSQPPIGKGDEQESTKIASGENAQNHIEMDRHDILPSALILHGFTTRPPL
jgi:hypothetical protein